ncbi:MAG: hypothetical protein AB1861_23390, partial [Cyanobacteriota bacterium]
PPNPPWQGGNKRKPFLPSRVSGRVWGWGFSPGKPYEASTFTGRQGYGMGGLIKAKAVRESRPSESVLCRGGRLLPGGVELAGFSVSSNRLEGLRNGRCVGFLTP